MKLLALLAAINVGICLTTDSFIGALGWMSVTIMAILAD